MPNPIDVTFELVTPAYAGGADRAKTDGLRPPTLKALLRFWWRAMHPELDSEQLFNAEEAIFGSTKEGQGIRVIPAPPGGASWPEPTFIPAGTRVTDAWHVYAAYGAVAWDVDAQKRQVPELTLPQEWSFRIFPRGAAGWDPQQKLAVENSLWLLSAFGGFGSRSRRGWGGLRARYGWTHLADPHGSNDINGTIRDGMVRVVGARASIRVAGGAARAEHSAFTGGPNESKVFVGPSATSAMSALQSLVELYHDYRKVLGRNYPHGPVGADYTIRRRWATRGVVRGDRLTAGSAFGLPNDATFRSLGRALVKVGAGPSADGRRASPVFFKVIGSGDSFRPVVLWLPTRFLPYQADITVAARGHRPGAVRYPGDGAISAFLNTLAAAGWQEVTW